MNANSLNSSGFPLSEALSLSSGPFDLRPATFSPYDVSNLKRRMKGPSVIRVAIASFPNLIQIYQKRCKIVTYFLQFYYNH